MSWWSLKRAISWLLETSNLEGSRLRQSTERTTGF